MKIIKTLTATFFLVILGSFVYASDITVVDAYARSSGKMAKAGAVFLTIKNHTNSEDRLLAVSSNVSEKVELHTHEKGQNGVLKMRHVEEGFVIPAGGVHALKRGADHIMFMGLKAPWNHGDIIDLSLIFEKAGEIKLQVTVDMKLEDQAHDH